MTMFLKFIIIMEFLFLNNNQYFSMSQQISKLPNIFKIFHPPHFKRFPIQSKYNELEVEKYSKFGSTDSHYIP